jgi:hypothetical protein
MFPLRPERREAPMGRSRDLAGASLGPPLPEDGEEHSRDPARAGCSCKKEKVDERFGYLEKLINLGAEPSGWLPLLFLNGSSVTTGRRIIVADATPWYCVRAERDPHTLEPRLFILKPSISLKLQAAPPSMPVQDTFRAGP